MGDVSTKATYGTPSASDPIKKKIKKVCSLKERPK